MLMIAMEGEKKQQKRATVTGTSTPKKKKKPENPEIGSSSTWTQDQLDLFEVRPARELEAKVIIPEKWFEFGNLENYQSGTKLALIYD